MAKLVIPVALASALAMFALGAAAAKTLTTQGDTTADQAAVATAQSSKPQGTKTSGTSTKAQPGKKALKKAKVTPPPPMHDPN